MSDIDPMAHPPVYKHDQIITRTELLGMLLGFKEQWEATHWWQWGARQRIKYSINTIIAVVQYLDGGKHSCE